MYSEHTEIYLENSQQAFFTLNIHLYSVLKDRCAYTSARYAISIKASSAGALKTSIGVDTVSISIAIVSVCQTLIDI